MAQSMGQSCHPTCSRMQSRRTRPLVAQGATTARMDALPARDLVTHREGRKHVPSQRQRLPSRRSQGEDAAKGVAGAVDEGMPVQSTD